VDSGPSFGNWELCIQTPFNEEGKLRSHIDEAGYNITLNSGKNPLTGEKIPLDEKHSLSTIVDIETWEVIYL